MNFNQLRTSWQTQTLPPSATAQEQLDTVRSQARKFTRSIFWRDVREVGACLVLTLVFSIYAFNQVGPARWGGIAMIAGSVFVALFMLVDRWRESRRSRVFGQTLAHGLRENLRALDHQIWLLRNVVWWYLLPLELGIAGWALGLGWGHPLWLLFYLLGFGLLGGLTAVFVYRLNQKAVDCDLRPQREALMRELEAWEKAAHEES